MHVLRRVFLITRGKGCHHLFNISAFTFFFLRIEVWHAYREMQLSIQLNGLAHTPRCPSDTDSDFNNTPALRQPFPCPCPTGPSPAPFRDGEVRPWSGRATGTPGCVTWAADAGVQSKLSPQPPPPSHSLCPAHWEAPRTRNVAELPHLPGSIHVQGLARGGRSEHSATQLPATGQPQPVLCPCPPGFLLPPHAGT